MIVCGRNLVYSRGTVDTSVHIIEDYNGLSPLG